MLQKRPPFSLRVSRPFRVRIHSCKTRSPHSFNENRNAQQDANTLWPTGSPLWRHASARMRASLAAILLPQWPSRTMLLEPHKIPFARIVPHFTHNAWHEVPHSPTRGRGGLYRSASDASGPSSVGSCGRLVRALAPPSATISAMVRAVAPMRRRAPGCDLSRREQPRLLSNHLSGLSYRF